MKSKNITTALSIILLFIMAFESSNLHAQTKSAYQLENPMTVAYLKKQLNKQTPRLVLNKKINRNLKKKLNSDTVVLAFYEILKTDAEDILEQPLLERVMVGRRMSTGKIRKRLITLGMVYHISKDSEILDRINHEILSVCTFSDWNPSHYLDVAGTALSVALAIDWAGKDLPLTTVEIAKQALIDKGILPSYNKQGNTGWINGNNNWNQVCNSGMVAASIVIAEKDPELAAKTISRALDGIPNALVAYGSDGAYPEGASYWGYGTIHTVFTASILQSAFDTDFGISNFPGFIESANYVPMLTSPSGEFFNFYDCGSNVLANNRGFGDASVAMFNNSSITVNLMWFATQTGNSFYYDESYFTDQSENRRRNSFDATALVWLSQFEAKKNEQLPSVWKGEGDNPLVVFRGGEDNPELFYFGGKGGKASNSHGNMDVGSFVFELGGVRWSIDPGSQGYNELEQAGFDLWGNCQNCERWTLLTKSNFGHSTISINDQLHIVDGKATIIDFQDGENPEATFDMTPVFAGQLKSAKRRFVKDSPSSMVIEDQIEISEETKMITWQMMTIADVEIVNGGAILKQEGKTLKLENMSHPDLSISLVSLYPAPLKLDRQIEGLKRIEIRIPAWTVEGDNCNIKVRLAGEQ